MTASDAEPDADATALLADPAALRARADRDGFLFLRGLLPREAVMDLRRETLALAAAEKLLDPRYPLSDGIAAVDTVGMMQSWNVTCGTPTLYRAVQKLPRFHALAHHPRLLALYRALFAGDVLVHPRHIMRLMFPMQGVYPTDPHQDFSYIHGTPNTWTAWIPIGDCPVATGNLTVLRGSHKAGLLPVRTGAGGAGGLETILDGIPADDWVSFNFQAGDVLTFPSLTVHKSWPTQHPERVRLSLDYRYQPLGEPVHASSLEPHIGVLSWEEIYRDWPDQTYQYYWTQHDLNVETRRSEQRP